MCAAPPPPPLQPSWLVTEFSLYVAHCSTMCGSAYSLERKPWKEEDTQSKVVLSNLFTCGQLLLHIRVDNVMEFGALVPGVQVSANTDSFTLWLNTEFVLLIKIQ